jgi:hypothetical protein
MYEEKGQMDKQRNTKYTHKTKDRVTRTLLKTGVELIGNSALFIVLSVILRFTNSNHPLVTSNSSSCQE